MASPLCVHDSGPFPFRLSTTCKSSPPSLSHILRESFSGCGPGCRSSCLLKYLSSQPQEAIDLFNKGRAAKKAAKDPKVAQGSSGVRSGGEKKEVFKAMDKKWVMRSNEGWRQEQDGEEGSAEEGGRGGGEGCETAET